MQALAVVVSCVLAAPGGPAKGAKPGAKVKLETQDQKVIYSLGQLMGLQFGTLALTPEEQQLLLQSIQDAVDGKPAMDPSEVGEQIDAFARKRTKESTEKFLAAAAKEKGAEKTASGLIFTSQAEGKGESPKATDTVEVDYEGRLPNGYPFDASAKHGGPASFPVNGVVPCWTEALQKMKPGGKAKLVCPPELAYGERGSPPVIPPGAPLTFEVTLRKVAPAAAAPAPAAPAAPTGK